MMQMISDANRRLRGSFFVALLAAFVLTFTPQATSAQTPALQAAQPTVEEWRDDFDGDRLDDTKWEQHTFAGGGGVKIEVKDKQLRQRGVGGSRSGVRSKQMFRSDNFYVEAALAKVGKRTPEQGENSDVPGSAVLTVLFDGNPANRIEWLLRSDGIFEAWMSVDGRMERVDDGKLATKEKNPLLGIRRNGEKVSFLLNGQVGLERTLRGLSPNFKVMLYGYGNSDNNWDSARVRMIKQ